MVFTLTVHPQVSKVEVITNASGNFELQRNGEPYYIKGAGAKDHFDLLVKSGANSIRIWSTNNNALLDSAYHHNLSCMVKPIPLQRAPRLDDSVDLDAMLLSILAKNIDIMVEAANEIKDLDDVVQEFDSGATNITGTFTAFERATKNVLTLSSKLGLSPADREKLMSFANTKDDKVDPYESLKHAAMG